MLMLMLKVVEEEVKKMSFWFGDIFQFALFGNGLIRKIGRIFPIDFQMPCSLDKVDYAEKKKFAGLSLFFQVDTFFPPWQELFELSYV